MLVLMRNPGESIMIGEDIEFVVLRVHQGRVRIGIKAPADVPIHREEIYEKIQKGEEPPCSS